MGIYWVQNLESIRCGLKWAALLMMLSITGISQTIAQQTSEADGTLRRIRVPILMYHYVGTLPEDADPYRINLTLDAETFAGHMQYLSDQGYSTISLYEVDQALETGTRLPDKPVVLTFDDAYIDHYTNVFPILQRYGFSGTFFIPTQYIDNNTPGYMSWSQIQEMSTAGMNMESHTKHHIDLRNRSHDLLVFEIIGSIETIEHHTGVPARMFCYPVGRYDDDTLSMLRTTTIERAVTTEPGVYHTTDNRYLMPRLRITNETSVAGLAYLLENN